MTKSTRGIVYAVINPKVNPVEGDKPWVKIGMTGDSVDDLKARIRSLSTGVPGRYHACYAVSVKNAKKAETLLHTVFEHCDSDGEFFIVSPTQAEAALKLTQEHGQTSGDVANGITRYLNRTRDGKGRNQANKNTARKAKPGRAKKQSRKPPFKFSRVGIRVGAKLLFYKSDSIKAKVAEDNKVRFDGKGEAISLSKAASMAYEKIGRTRNHPQGPACWKHKGKLLINIPISKADK